MSTTIEEGTAYAFKGLLVSCTGPVNAETIEVNFGARNFTGFRTQARKIYLTR